MEYAISIKLTEKQYHILRGMAKDEYRTIGNTATMLMAEGFAWYIQDHDLCIYKRPEDRDLGCDREFQRYTDKELNEIFSEIPLIQ
jgi:hypothetical protein